MTTPDTFDPVPATVRRDRWGRPYVVPPQGGKPKAYTRTTTFVDVLDDKYNLQQWFQRMVAIGLADRPDLLLAVAAHRDDKDKLNEITGQARDAAAAGAAATTGTAVHALTERIDRGQPLGVIPAAYQADLDAYRRATAALSIVEIEQFGVHDDYTVAGTWDRLVYYDGRYLIADVKTGSIVYSGLKIAMQLAFYSRMTPYDPATGQRQPRQFEVDTTQAIVIHLPAGEGQCQLYWVDITQGWAAVQCAAGVRRWRAYKSWFSSLEATVDDDYHDLFDRIARAETVNELRQIWTRAIATDTWTQDHTTAALARKAQLEGTP